MLNKRVLDRRKVHKRSDVSCQTQAFIHHATTTLTTLYPDCSRAHLHFPPRAPALPLKGCRSHCWKRPHVRVQPQEQEPEVSAYDVTGKLGSMKPVVPDGAGGTGVPGPEGARSLKEGQEVSSEMAAVRLGKPGRSGLTVFPRPLGSVHTSASGTRTVQSRSDFPACPTLSPWQRCPTAGSGGPGARRCGCTYVRAAQHTSQLRVGLWACRGAAAPPPSTPKGMRKAKGAPRGSPGSPKPGKVVASGCPSRDPHPWARDLFTSLSSFLPGFAPGPGESVLPASPPYMLTRSAKM